jgi:hypothetical protein
MSNIMQGISRQKFNFRKRKLHSKYLHLYYTYKYKAIENSLNLTIITYFQI